MKESPVNDCALALMCLAQTSGGYERLADMIETEWIKFEKRERVASHREHYNMRKWQQWEFDYIIQNYGKLGIGQMAVKLGRTYGSVDGKITKIVKVGKFVRKRFARRVS